ncbi:MAG: hypothetical protein RL114_113 [Actinomycetota bacterium]
MLTSPLALRVAQYLEHQPSVCPLQQFAGMACPSCGGTRAVFYLWGADPVQAVKSNAGVTILVLCLAALMVAGKIDLMGVLGAPNDPKLQESPR